MNTKQPLITGKYTPAPSSLPIDFEIHSGNNDAANKLIILPEASDEIIKVYPNGYGIALPITPASFEHFKKNVLNKEDVSQYVAEVPQTVSIPGTWRSSDNMNTEPPRIKGEYTPPSPGAPIGFEIYTGENATDNKVIKLYEYSRDIFYAYRGSKGEDLHITPASFEYFKKSVLNKNVPWKNVVVARVVSIPGTWQSNNSYVSGSSRKPKRNRLSSRRKSNKRRRSRRNVNRKTKKN
jgi:hypothetical protein